MIASDLCEIFNIFNVHLHHNPGPGIPHAFIQSNPVQRAEVQRVEDLQRRHSRQR